jgi:hypothetical protein
MFQEKDRRFFWAKWRSKWEYYQISQEKMPLRFFRNSDITLITTGSHIILYHDPTPDTRNPVTGNRNQVSGKRLQKNPKPETCNPTPETR